MTKNGYWAFKKMSQIEQSEFAHALFREYTEFPFASIKDLTQIHPGTPASAIQKIIHCSNMLSSDEIALWDEMRFKYPTTAFFKALENAPDKAKYIDTTRNALFFKGCYSDDPDGIQTLDYVLAKTWGVISNHLFSQRAIDIQDEMAKKGIEIRAQHIEILLMIYSRHKEAIVTMCPPSWKGYLHLKKDIRGYSPSLVVQIAEAYVSGLKAIDIARQYGLGLSAVYTIIKKDICELSPDLARMCYARLSTTSPVPEPYGSGLCTRDVIALKIAKSYVSDPNINICDISLRYGVSHITAKRAMLIRVKDLDPELYAQVCDKMARNKISLTRGI